jgi:hypothetical protein
MAAGKRNLVSFFISRPLPAALKEKPFQKVQKKSSTPHPCPKKKLENEDDKKKFNPTHPLPKFTLITLSHPHFTQPNFFL